MRSTWLPITSSLVLFLATSWLGLYFLERKEIHPVLEQARLQQKTQLPLLQQDLSDLEKISELHKLLLDQNQEPQDQNQNQLREQEDASEFLNPLVHWQSVSSQAPLSVPPQFTEKLWRERDLWLAHGPRLLKSFQKTNISLNFFSQLSRFKIWSLEKKSPLASVIALGDYIPNEALPVPSTIDLWVLSRMRLIQGTVQRDALSALQDVQALARLMMTTENLNLWIAGLSLLDMGYFAYKYYIKKRLLTASVAEQWSAYAENNTKKANRAFWAARSYLYPWTSPEQIREVYLNTRGPSIVGLCALLNDATPMIWGLEPMLRPHWPFETDLEPQYQEFGRLLEMGFKKCRMPYLRALMQEKKFNPQYPIPRLLLTMPYSRKLFALKLATIPLLGFEAYSR